jgi:hypothetical protein
VSAVATQETGDLTKQEQANVRAALRFLRARCGGWASVAKVLHLGESTLAMVGGGHRTVTPLIAFRVAKFAKVGVDDVLGGRFPEPGTCPMCGHRKEEAS